MFVRGLTLCLSLAVASVAQAGVVVTLVEQIPGPHQTGELVTVDVRLSQNPVGTDVYLRMVQLDFSASDPELDLSAGVTHSDPSPSIELWVFDGAANCAGDPALCGDSHLIDADFSGDLAKVVSMAFGSNVQLEENTNMQVLLPGNGSSVKVGEIQATSAVAGTFTLNALNGGDTDPDAGAQVRFGFGADQLDGVAITLWSAENGQVIGGTVELTFVGGVDLIDSNYACGQSLTRTQNHLLRLTFDGPIAAPTPGAGELIICELQDNNCGADLSADFTFTVEGGNVLKIVENGTVLSNETWYGVMNTGAWSGVSDFEMDYVVVRGDVSNNGRTQFADLSEINQNLTNSAADDDVYDIDANARVQFADISAANQSMNSIAPAIPVGHVCTLP